MVYRATGRWRKHQGRPVHRYRVWLNRQEVSDRCFYADPRRGVVRLFLHNSEGRPYLSDLDTVATEERRGRVVVRKMAAQ
jgi:hypothetical protein